MVYRLLAEKYGLAETSLKRHFTNHVAQEAKHEPKAKVEKQPPEEKEEAQEVEVWAFSKKRSIQKSDQQIELTESLTDRTYVDYRPSGQHIEEDIKPGVQTAFLAAFVELANESGACRAVRVSRQTVRYWEKVDLEFSLRYHDAQDQVNDIIRSEIYRRAIVGYEDTVVSAKGESFTVTKFSDRLLEFWAKARMKEFREKAQVDITSNGQTVAQGNTSVETILTMQQALANEMSSWRRERIYYDDLNSN
jgi:hypothetical protein